MKKTYIMPEALTVVLGTCKMMAESAPTLGVDTGDSEDPNNFDAKGISDVNIWDEEW